MMVAEKLSTMLGIFPFLEVMFVIAVKDTIDMIMKLYQTWKMLKLFKGKQINILNNFITEIPETDTENPNYWWIKADIETQKSKIDKYLTAVKAGKLRGKFKMDMKNCDKKKLRIKLS